MAEPRDPVRGRAYRDILVVDLLGGIGDLLMVLPVIHGLAAANPGADLRVVTHAPGSDLLRTDPAVSRVHVPQHSRPGAEHEAVAAALVARRPDLAVTTTRYDGIPDLLRAGAGRAVTDLWRRPPAGEPVTGRYLQILRAQGVLDDRAPARPRVHLTGAERQAGEDVLRRRLGSAPGAAPVILVTEAGMRVKRWPARRWRRLAGILARHGHRVLAVPPGPFAEGLPAADLRQLAACFAALARRGGVVVGGDTGPARLAAAAGAITVGLFGPTPAARYGFAGPGGTDLQGLPACPHRRPTSITEQVCWWNAVCPLDAEPACLADLCAEDVADRVVAALARRRQA